MQAKHKLSMAETGQAVRETRLKNIKEDWEEVP